MQHTSFSSENRNGKEKPLTHLVVEWQSSPNTASLWLKSEITGGILAALFKFTLSLELFQWKLPHSVWECWDQDQRMFDLTMVYCVITSRRLTPLTLVNTYAQNRLHKSKTWAQNTPRRFDSVSVVYIHTSECKVTVFKVSYSPCEVHRGASKCKFVLALPRQFKFSQL